jgi:antitoxin MazE
MELSVINIGNSKGIRLSKTILEKYNIHDKIELILEKGFIVLKPKPNQEKTGKKHSKKCMKTETTNF